jgi:hypothetical protein
VVFGSHYPVHPSFYTSYTSSQRPRELRFNDPRVKGCLQRTTSVADSGDSLFQSAEASPHTRAISSKISAFSTGHPCVLIFPAVVRRLTHTVLSAYLSYFATSDRFLENLHYLILRKSLSHLVLLLKRTIHHPVAISGGAGHAFMPPFSVTRFLRLIGYTQED